MWLMRSVSGFGVAGLSALALSACGGSEPRGQLPMAPRPELTSPPGEMSAQRLVLMKGTTGENKGKSLGSIAIAPEGRGVVMRLELRGLPEGVQLITFNEEADCSGEEREGTLVPAAGAGLPWGPDGAPLKLPTIEAPPEGQVRTEFLVPGITVADTRPRALVITKGGVRIGCGVAK